MEPARNVELKAHDPDPDGTLERALAAGAQDHGVLLQRDTYFTVAQGRLKLREEEPGGATLIAYRRPDEAREHVSSYRLVPVADPEPLRDALGAVGGVAAVVVKRRRLLLWETVRIHLDDVRGLGTFVELEAVAAADSDLTREHAQVAELRERLGIGDAALREGSYADALTTSAPRTEPTLSCWRLPARRPAARTRPTRGSRSAPRCARSTAAAMRARTSRTPHTRRASARKHPRSAR